MLERSDPRMHTAEHLLNAAMTSLVGSGRSFSAHLDGRKGKCDYRFDRDLKDDERRRVEAFVNEAIAADLPVNELSLPRDRAEARFDLSRLPESAGGIVRVIEIPGRDAVPCAGAHAGRTGELGRFSIAGTSFGDGRLRVRFALDAPDRG